MRVPERALARKRRYRRRLRSRIILSFVIFGFGLTALIASTAVYLRNRVEDQVISAALTKNNNVFADQNGGVHRRNSNGNWQSQGNRGWQPSTSTRPSTMNRDYGARQRGATRSSMGGRGGGGRRR